MAQGVRWYLGQMFGVMGPGLILARHVFKGLRREMFVGDDKRAASDKLALSWRPERDARLAGPKENPILEFNDAPKDRVFVVYISLNQMLGDFPDIYGWAEHWAWVQQSAELPEAPVEYEVRFDNRLWSRE